MAKRKTRAKRKALLCPIPARQPNGRSREGNPSPTERRELAQAVVLRQRVAHGATLDNATDQRHATNAGRWFLAGRLSDDRREPQSQRALDRYHAAIWYADLHRQMRRAIEARDPNAGAPSSRTTGGQGIDAASCLKAIARHRDAERTIPRACKTVVWRFLICEDEPSADPRILPAIIAACDALNLVRMGARNR